MVDTFEPTGRRCRTVQVDDAAEAYLEAFDLNGVDYLFNSPGTEFAPLWDHFAAGTSLDGFPQSPQGVAYVGCRHEAVAVQMAMGYAAVKGRPQVVGLHVTVGSLHAAMSLHGAYRSRIPLVVATSHADTHEHGRRGGMPGSHYLQFNAPGGFEDYFARYMKWLGHPEDPRTAVKHVGRAFRLTVTPPAGPVLVNLSREVLYDDGLAKAEVTREARGSPPTAPANRLDAVTEALEYADNPAIVAGLTSPMRRNPRGLIALAERLDAPVIEYPKRYRGMPVEHPLSLGDGTFVDHYLGKNVDCVLVLDSEHPWYPPEAGAPEGATIVVISPEPDRAKLDYWNYPVDVLLTADPLVVVEGLLDRLPEGDRTGPIDWRAEHERLRAFWARQAEAGAGEVPLDPCWLGRELDRRLPDDAILVVETTVHRGIMNNLLRTRDRDYLNATKVMAGGLGAGLGMALGAKLAVPDRPVVALVGDGALYYNPTAAALGAASEHGLPFMTVVLDNGGYASQRSSYRRNFPDGRAADTGIYPGTVIQPTPDYDQLAAVWGAHGVSVREESEVAGAVEAGLAALDDGSASLLACMLDGADPRGDLAPPGS